MKVRMIRNLFLCVSLTLLGSIAWTEAFLSQRNNLAFQEDWKLATLDFLNPAIVSVPVYASTFVLQGYRLKSTPDLGVIRLLAEEEFAPDELSFWFQLKRNGFVELVLDPSTHLRISRSRFFPSALIRKSSSEKYEEVLPLDIRPDEGFHSAVVKDGTLRFGGKSFVIPGLVLSAGRPGIQISPEGAEVFAMKMSGQDGSRFLHFLPDGNRFSLYARHWGILTGIVFLLALILRGKTIRIASFLSAAGILVFFVEALIGVDHHRNPEGLRTKFEALDAWWVPPGQTSLAKKMRALKKNDADTALFLCSRNGCQKTEIMTLPPKKSERILIFGGSQSKYGLVRQYEDSFHFQLDKALRAEKPEVETINISTPGLFRDRLRAYGNSLPRVEADTIILESLALKEDWPLLRTFLAETKKQGIRTIFLRTPQNLLKFSENEIPYMISETRKGLDAHPEGLPESNKWIALNSLAFLRETQKETGFIFLDPNQLFLEDRILTSGQLFWDATHLTGYGQKLLADWVAGEILKLD